MGSLVLWAFRRRGLQAPVRPTTATQSVVLEQTARMQATRVADLRAVLTSTALRSQEEQTGGVWFAGSGAGEEPRRVCDASPHKETAGKQCCYETLHRYTHMQPGKTPKAKCVSHATCPYAESHDEDVKHMGMQGGLPRGEQGRAGQTRRARQPASSRWAENPRSHSHSQHPASQLPACQ